MYKIRGKERRILKRELNQLKSFVKHFWWNEEREPLERNDNDELVSLYNESISEIQAIERRLSEIDTLK